MSRSLAGDTIHHRLRKPVFGILLRCKDEETVLKHSDLKQIIEQELLPRAEKPSRYLGNEWNSVHKDASQMRLRVALMFPDLYELGLGNLGLHILYAI